MVFQVFERLRRTPAFEVFRRGAQHAPIAHQFARQMLARQVIADEDFQIEALAHQIDHPVEHVQPNVEFRARPGQLTDRRRHMITAETEAAANVQRPRRLVPGLGNLAEKLIEISQQFLRPNSYALAVISQRDASGGAVQQLARQRGFQHRDALADVGR